MRELERLKPSLHIELQDLGNLSASDLLAIDGPKFITSDGYVGARTFAVIIPHEMWKRLNHGLPAKPRKRTKR